MTIPGRARNSIHTAAAMAPSSEKRNRLRAKPSDDVIALGSRSSSDTATPTTQPIAPDSSVAANERRTPSTPPDERAGEQREARTPARAATGRRRGARDAEARREDRRASRRRRGRAGAQPAPRRRARRRRDCARSTFLSNLPTLVFGHLVDERPPLGQLPLGDVRRRGTRAARRRHASTPVAQHDARERALVPAVGRARAITAASTTSGCAMRWPSSSTDEIHSPPDLMTSFARSVIWM